MSWHDFVTIGDRCSTKEEFMTIKQLEDVYVIHANLDVEKDKFYFDVMVKPPDVLEDDYQGYVSIAFWLLETTQLEQFKNTTKETSTVKFSMEDNVICCTIKGGYEAVIKCKSVYCT